MNALELVRGSHASDPTRLYVREFPPPAPGDDFEIVVPGLEVWDVLAIKANGTCTGNGRSVNLHITNGDVDVAVLASFQSLLTFTPPQPWTWARAGFVQNGGVSLGSYVPLPSWAYLPGYAFRAETTDSDCVPTWTDVTAWFYNYGARHDDG